MTQVGQNDPFLINQLFEYLVLSYRDFYNRIDKMDQEQVNAFKKVWASHLKHIPLNAITKAKDNCLTEFPDLSPNVGQFVDLCKRYMKPPITKNLPKPEATKKDMAWAATRLAFGRKKKLTLKGQQPRDLVGEIVLGFDFPFQEIADKVDWPDTADLQAHRKAWGKLKESFQAIWRERKWAQ